MILHINVNYYTEEELLVCLSSRDQLLVLMELLGIDACVVTRLED